MTLHDPTIVSRPERDRRVGDARRFLEDRRHEATCMIALWERSRKPWAPDELAYWRGVLAEVQRIERELARLERGRVNAS